MSEINELFFDEPVIGDPEPVDSHVCPRCNTEFDTMEDLAYIDEHHVCPSCLSDLTLQAAEESMDI